MHSSGYTINSLVCVHARVDVHNAVKVVRAVESVSQFLFDLYQMWYLGHVTVINT